MADRVRLDAEWAAEQAPRLLAEARAEALEIAREQLRASLVDALLAAAERLEQPAAPDGEPTAQPHEPAATAAEPAPPPPAAQGTVSRLGVWLYGVLPGDAEDPPPLVGVDGEHAVELLRHEGLAALISAVPLETFGEDALREVLEDLGRLEALARAHERVLDQALGMGALVPFRLCTIYEHPDGVREMLDREREMLADALARLSGMAEWGVKGFLVAARDTGEGTTDDAAASGTEYLSRKRRDREAAEAARQAAEARLERIHAQLGEHAAAAVVSRPHDRGLSGRDDEMVLNASYLVPDGRAEEFRRLVGELAERDAPAGIVLELTGPWPAYHFTELAPAR